jgi:hypothetical protein
MKLLYKTSQVPTRRVNADAIEERTEEEEEDGIICLTLQVT